MDRDDGYQALKHMEAMINLKCIVWKQLSMTLFQAAAQCPLWSALGQLRGSREQALSGSQMLYIHGMSCVTEGRFDADARVRVHLSYLRERGARHQGIEGLKGPAACGVVSLVLNTSLA